MITCKMYLWGIKNEKIGFTIFMIAFLGIGSYGDDFLQNSVRVSIVLPSNSELMSYAPMATPTSTTVTIGASLDTNSVIGGSFSYSYIENDVYVINNSSTLRGIYDITYDFRQDNWNEFTTSEVYSYGMLIFRYSGSQDINVDINVNYHDWNGFEGEISSINYNVPIIN